VSSNEEGFYFLLLRFTVVPKVCTISAQLVDDFVIE
jgi:hypothetical protein